MFRLCTIFLMLFGTSVWAQKIEPEVYPPYDRASQFGGWIDADGDCMNTRHEVLAQESLVPPNLSPNGCSVVAGLWFDPYTEKTFTNPRRLDIDHLVPLKEAHESGAWRWEREVGRAYANDLSNPGHLMAVELGANRRKGSRDPAEWLPPNEKFRCAYVLAWLAVKQTWGLFIDAAEDAAIRTVLEDDQCEPSP